MYKLIFQGKDNFTRIDQSKKWGKGQSKYFTTLLTVTQAPTWQSIGHNPELLAQDNEIVGILYHY